MLEWLIQLPLTTLVVLLVLTSYVICFLLPTLALFPIGTVPPPVELDRSRGNVRFLVQLYVDELECV